MIESARLDNRGSPNNEGAFHFVGRGERRVGALVAPQLSSHVAVALRDGAVVKKEQRKSRKEKRRVGKGGIGGAQGSGESRKIAGKGGGTAHAAAER